MGKAYGFFHCNSPAEAIEHELPLVRKLAETPGIVALLVEDARDVLLPSTALMELLQEGLQRGRNRMMEAVYPGQLHEKAADELAMILNVLYQSPFYREGDEFLGDIVYSCEREWVFRE